MSEEEESSRGNGENSGEYIKRSKDKVKEGTGLSHEFSVNVGVHQGSVLLPLLFAIVVDAVAERVRDGSINEILYANNLVLVGETMEYLMDKFLRWKEAFERKGMRVLKKTKMMVRGLEEKVTESKIDPCGVCERRVKVNTVFCTNCARWVHGRCTSMIEYSWLGQEFLLRIMYNFG